MIETLLWTILAVGLQLVIAFCIAIIVWQIAKSLVRWANQ